MKILWDRCRKIRNSVSFFFPTSVGACAHTNLRYLWKDVWRAFWSFWYFWSEEELDSKIFLVMCSETRAHYSSCKINLRGFLINLLSVHVYKLEGNSWTVTIDTSRYTYQVSSRIISWWSNKITITSPSNPLLSYFSWHSSALFSS